MPNPYELVLMLDADAPTDTRTKIVKDAEQLLAQHGEVKGTKNWGVRQLPYEIDHHGEADYSIFHFDAEPSKLSQLDRALKLTEGVLRFRIFDAESEDIPENPPLFKREERTYERPPREAQATAEIEESEPRPTAETPDAEAPAAEQADEETPAAE